MDEVDWGGVKVNGIPPLDHPKHVEAAEATQLKDKHVVFGVSLNGEARRTRELLRADIRARVAEHSVRQIDSGAAGSVLAAATQG